MIKRFALILFVFFAVGILINKSVKADGTYYNIGTSSSSNGSPDAVSWSQGNPIVIDSYGKFIVPIQSNGQVDYILSFSNDDGATWSEQSGLDLPGRAAVAYDSVNDTLLTLSAAGNGDVTFNRFLIRRDENYNITRFTQDGNITPLLIDSNGACADSASGNPVILVQKINNINKAVIFWSISKHDCSGVDLTATRGAYLDITNTGTDDDLGSWQTLDGSPSPGGSTAANIAFSQIYSVADVEPFYQHSALIKSSGTNVNDIYYFNIDTNHVHEFRRFSFNTGTNKWSNGATAPALFGGDVNDSQGYNLKRELLSKPIEDTVHNSVYVGLARWLDNTNGDTQSLFYADSADTMNLAADVYSAGGTHCIYPTFDIAFDNILGQVNMFYNISGASNVCGNVYYKTFNGTTLSAAIPFYTVANRSVDIPIAYKSNYKDKINLFFRLNNAVTPGIPPHEIYYGFINTVPELPPSTPANGANNNEDFGYADFNKVCAGKSDVDITGAGIADIRLKAEFLEEFETPNNPYTLVYDDKWDLPSTWGAGVFEPKPNGEVNIYTANGGYLISRPTFTPNHSFSFTANFTQKNFEHIGLVDGNGFNQYIIFSTGSDGILKARTADGGEINTVIGTSYYNSYHTYTINWTVSNLVFLIDGVSVASFTTNIPTIGMHLILSNNDHSAGSDLLVDSLKTSNYQSLSGTYTSCPIDSGIASADWLVANYGATISAGQTVEFQVSTSDDLITWSAWSGALNTGNNIASPLGRYAQYLVTLTSASPVTSPSVYDVNLTFAPPVPPDAVNDSASTAQDTAVDINVLANDVITTALNGSSPSITVAAAHGTAVVTNLAGGVVTYTPTVGYSGTDVFTYQICDTDALCDTAVVNITINPAPVVPDPDPVTDGANNGVGNSSGASSNTCPETKPGIPTILSAISSDPTKMNVKYQSGSGTFTKFNIEFTKLSQSYKDTDIVKIEKNILEYNATNLNPNTTYFFRMRAENGCATSDWSSEFKAVTTTEKTTISTSGDVGKTPVSSPVDQSGFKTEYLLIICCPLAIVLLIIFASRKKKDKNTPSDYNERFR